MAFVRQAVVLEALLPVHPIAAVILEHRHVAKLLEGFITSIKAHLDRVPRPPTTAGKVRAEIYRAPCQFRVLNANRRDMLISCGAQTLGL
jgi:hypothetical protein